MDRNIVSAVKRRSTQPDPIIASFRASANESAKQQAERWLGEYNIFGWNWAYVSPIESTIQYSQTRRKKRVLLDDDVCRVIIHPPYGAHPEQIVTLQHAIARHATQPLS
jgi:hypothetical protein